jgi:high-affinity nickel permease
MRVVLFLLAIFAFLAGANALMEAKSVFHEIVGVILFLISAVFISAAAVVEAVGLLRKQVATERRLMAGPDRKVTGVGAERGKLT